MRAALSFMQTSLLQDRIPLDPETTLGSISSPIERANAIRDRMDELPDYKYDKNEVGHLASFLNVPVAVVEVGADAAAAAVESAGKYLVFVSDSGSFSLVWSRFENLPSNEDGSSSDRLFHTSVNEPGL